MSKKKEKPQPKKSTFSKKILFLSSILGTLTLILIIELLFLNRIYPGIYIARTNVSGLTPIQANQKIFENINNRLNQKIIFAKDQNQYYITLSPEDILINSTDVSSKALDFGRTIIYYSPQNLDVNIKLQPSLNLEIAQIAKKVDQPSIDSQVKYENGEINVTPSQNGLVLDQEKLKQEIISYLNTGNLPPSKLPTKTSYPNISYQQALQLKKSLDEIKLKPIVLHFEDQTYELGLDKILPLIDLTSSQPSLIQAKILDQNINISSIKVGENEYSDNKLVLSPKKLNNYLITLSQNIDRPVKEPLFNFDGKKVTQFQPPVEGKKLLVDQTASLINNALVAGNPKDINLPVETTLPKNKLTNDLGIKELIGTGISNFAGSIPNRIFNIGLAASKINGVLIRPEDTFSFVDTVGDISSASGYKQAYVIKSGRTVLDDGGGVCQVSTTLFRTVLNSGLPVIDRTAHAYRVGYYEQGFPPGLDATIFTPSVDFKFKNDTGHHILIQTEIDGLTLYINFYGTPDGRIARISTPVISNQTPPPPELRQDDPTLPKGTIKQVDFPAWGANVSFTRTVTRNGETLIKETYKSNYRPWQAVYLVGTGG